MSAEILRSTAQRLRAVDTASFNVFIGLDGFVDNIIDVVDKRTDAVNYARVETIGQLGERISRAAGLSRPVMM